MYPGRHEFCSPESTTMMKDQMKKTQPPASRGPNPNPPNNAEIVFSRVLQLLQQNGQGGSSANQTCLKNKHTIADVQEEVTKAQKRYSLRSKDSKVRKWLSRFSAGVLYYGRILDVLVQHHPEYVSLAWGTTKLLFVVSSKFARSDNTGTGAVHVDSSLSRWICPLRETKKIARRSRLSLMG